jgi:hypothetical protein
MLMFVVEPVVLLLSGWSPRSIALRARGAGQSNVRPSGAGLSCRHPFHRRHHQVFDKCRGTNHPYDCFSPAGSPKKRGAVPPVEWFTDCREYAP